MHSGAPTLVLGLLLLAGCGGGGDGGGTPPPTGVFADLRLPDVNPASATHGASVSPRDHLGRVSAWYFGHAT